MAVTQEQQIERERWRALRQIEDWLELPMAFLGLFWLVLLILELTRGLSPLLRDIGTLVWAVFVLDIVARFALAPAKLRFLSQNWLTLVSLLLPALRFLRAARVLLLLRAGRGVRLLRVLTSFNRGLRALRRTSRRRGIGFVLLLTAVVIATGAAGLYALERSEADGFANYGAAVWWVSRIVMTIGPDHWPVTPEGRLLALLLALYGYAMFGYVAGAFASFFVDRDAESRKAGVAGRRQIAALEHEIRLLRNDLRERSRASRATALD